MILCRIAGGRTAYYELDPTAVRLDVNPGYLSQLKTSRKVGALSRPRKPRAWFHQDGVSAIGNSKSEARARALALMHDPDRKQP